MLAFNGAMHTWNRFSELTVTLVDTPQVIPAIYLRAASLTPEPWSTLVKKLNKKLGIARVMSEGSIHVSKQNGNYTIGALIEIFRCPAVVGNPAVSLPWQIPSILDPFQNSFPIRNIFIFMQTKAGATSLMRRDYRRGIFEKLLDGELSIDRGVTMILSFVISIVTQRH